MWFWKNIHSEKKRAHWTPSLRKMHTSRKCHMRFFGAHGPVRSAYSKDRDGYVCAFMCVSVYVCLCDGGGDLFSYQDAGVHGGQEEVMLSDGFPGQAKGFRLNPAVRTPGTH